MLIITTYTITQNQQARPRRKIDGMSEYGLVGTYFYKALYNWPIEPITNLGDTHGYELFIFYLN